MNNNIRNRLVVGFSVIPPGTSSKQVPATPLGKRVFPEWASLLKQEVAYNAVEKRRKRLAKAMACPDKRLHPHLCNCKNPRIKIPTPKTKSLQRICLEKKQLLKRHLLGETNMHERVKAATYKYTPSIQPKDKAHYIKSPHYELYIPLQNPLEEAASQIQRVFRGSMGRNNYRKEYFFQSVRKLAKYFDDWKAVVAYNHNLRKLKALKFIQHNYRMIKQWRYNRDHFLIRSKQMVILLNLLERLFVYFKYTHAWRDFVVFKLHRRKFRLTWFHLRHHTSLCKLFRGVSKWVLRHAFRNTVWRNVLKCRRIECKARCSIALSRWKKFCTSNKLLKHRRKRVTFKAWTFYWKNSMLSSRRRYRLWGAGILQREFRAYIGRRNYTKKITSIRLINRFWRGTLGRWTFSRKWTKRANNAILSYRWKVWWKATILFKKERVYRENVTARLGDRKAFDKKEDWSNLLPLRKKVYGSSVRGAFPLPVPRSQFPIKGTHIVDRWKPPSEWYIHGSLSKSNNLWEKARGSAALFLRKIRKTSTSDRITTNEKVLRPNTVKTLTLSQAKEATAKMASLGYLEVLQWLRINKCAWNEDVIAEAAKNGHLNIIKWAYKNNAPYDETACENAAFGGHINCLRYCLELNFPCNMKNVVKYAAKGQQTKVVQWLSKTQTGFVVSPDCIVIAILGSKTVGPKDDEPDLIPLLECLYENALDETCMNSLLSESACTAAVQRGNLSCLKWLRRFGAPWDYRVLTAVRELKRRKILDWIMQNGGDQIKIPSDKVKIKYTFGRGDDEKVGILEKIRLKNEREAAQKAMKIANEAESEEGGRGRFEDEGSDCNRSEGSFDESSDEEY